MARGNINFSHSGSADDMEFARSGSPSKYDDLIDAVCRLNHKQTITVPLKPGDDAEKARLRLRQALNRYVPNEVHEYKRFEVRKSASGSIVIIGILLSREDPDLRVR
jgi:hypothetical protein